MAINNYIPNSRLTQAGVCTSSTRPASPYEGQYIYETDTNTTLYWDGSGWEYASGSLPNIVEATSTTAYQITSASYVATNLSVTITKQRSTSVIWVVCNPVLGCYSAAQGGDGYTLARLIETGSSRERNFGRVIRNYNNGNPIRVASAPSYLQWIDTASGTGSRTYRLDIAADTAHAEMNQYFNGASTSSIMAWEVMQ